MSIRQLRFTVLASLLLLGLSNPQAFPTCEKTEPDHVGIPEIELEPQLTWAEKRYQADLQRLALILSKLTRQKPELTQRIVGLADQLSLEYNVDTLRTLGIVLTESYANPDAVSYMGAIGLMQVMPATGEFIAEQLSVPWRGQDSLKEVPTNLRYGVWYYGHLVKVFRGNDRAALAAYFWGPHSIKRRLARGRPLPQKYLSQVLRSQKILERKFHHENPNSLWRSVYTFRHCASQCQYSYRP